MNIFSQDCFVAYTQLECDVKKLEAKEELTEKEKFLIDIEKREMELLKKIQILGSPAKNNKTFEQYKKELDEKSVLIMMTPEEYSEFLKINSISGIIDTICDQRIHDKQLGNEFKINPVAEEEIPKIDIEKDFPAVLNVEFNKVDHDINVGDTGIKINLQK